MLRSILLAAVVVFGFCFVSTAHADDNATLSSRDSKFIEKACTGGHTEVALGKLAVSKASSQEVKDFGQKMIDDHTKANDELKDLAKSKGLDLQKGQDKAIKHEQHVAASLEKKEGADFDKAYMNMMVKDHNTDVKEFKSEADKGDDADVKAFAAKTLPTLEEHQTMAKDIQAKLEK